MALNQKRKFIFIYNAKGGRWNSTLDLVHKYVSPSTYKCSLCKITFNIGMKEIAQIRSLSLWIFLVPFVAVNTCLLISVNYHLFENDICNQKKG